MDIEPGHTSPQLEHHESDNSEPFDAVKFNHDVLNAIQQYRATYSAFPYPTKLVDHALLLYIVASTFLPSWQIEADTCLEHLDKSEESLYIALENAYENQEFPSLLKHHAMLPVVVERAAGLSDQQISLPLNLRSVFRGPYIGETAKLLIESLNDERTAYLDNDPEDSPYSWSVSIVQSFGMGKSRTVEEAAKTVFTIPFNIRARGEDQRDAYPPPDDNIRLFFEERLDDDDKTQQAHYMFFLWALFTRTRKLLKTRFQELSGDKLALEWATYLGKGQTVSSVGQNRRDFYKTVVDVATTEIFKRSDLKLHQLEHALQVSCSKLIERIQSTSNSNTNACFVYFDEAHSLIQAIKNRSKEHERNQFHNLGIVLSKLISYRIFFIFLSDNSSLRGFAPPPIFVRSARVVVRSQLVIPFTELPFDIHEHLVAQEFNSPGITLTRAYHLDVIVMFGRPLWYTMRQVNSQPDIFQYAMDKLSADGMPGHEADSALAALGVRLGIVFADKEIVFDEKETAVDENHPYWVQSRLVQSHMRIAYSIPRRRGYIHTGTPSEPVLAEAAGRYLSQGGRGGIAIEAPVRLSEALEKQILAPNGSKELVARLLVTAAHDIALENCYGRLQHQPNLSSYHRPIPVPDFLCALFHRDHHSKVLNAECLTRREGVKTLSDAFWNSYVFFSHFALAGDSEMLSVPALATALVRGMALQARDGQEFIDAVIPIHMGSLNVPVSAETTSAISLKIKNREGLSDCKIDRSITVPDANMPTISIVFELGITGKQSNTVEVSESCLDTGSKGADHVDDHHYEIVARGCSSKLFGPVTREMEAHYKTLLGAGSVWEDFARRDQPDNVEALRAMKPVVNGKQQVANYFGKPKPTANRQ